MTQFTPLPQELHTEAERLLRETDLTFAAIGARLGISPRTVGNWNAKAGWRQPRRLSQLSPANWPLARREAIARLYYESRNDPGDLAQACGTLRGTGRALFLALGLTLRRPSLSNPPPAPLDAATVADAPALRAALRGHVARQIAAFDAALQGASAAVIDSARVLRDLGGLKRLLDDLTAETGGGDGEGGTQDAAAGGAPEHLDLPALRAEIARRYARFAGEPAPAGLPGEPAGAPAAGPLP